MIPETVAAMKSAIGPAYMIPSIPKNLGNITSSGSRKIICLVKERNAPFTGFPMDVKKVDDIGWMLLINMKNR